MKTMKMLSKRYLAMLLVFAMCFSMMHLSVYAAETEPDIDFTLTVGEDTEDLRERRPRRLWLERRLPSCLSW